MQKCQVFPVVVFFVAFAICACRGALLRLSGDNSRRKLPQHPTSKIALLSGCCNVNARDWVFVMSMAPDCAKSAFRVADALHARAHVRFLVVSH